MSYTSTMTDGSTKEYLSVAETAALIRKALAKSFPGQKFYVRSHSYSGGASIDVYYDGIVSRTPTNEPPYWYETVTKPGAPAKADVERVTSGFAGRGFDGMIDLAYGISASVDADGNVTGTKSAGSYGSVPGWDGTKPGDRVVSFGANYVFVNDELPFDVREKRAAS